MGNNEAMEAPECNFSVQKKGSIFRLTPIVAFCDLLINLFPLRCEAYIEMPVFREQGAVPGTDMRIFSWGKT
jgi:hypothetical protein